MMVLEMVPCIVGKKDQAVQEARRDAMHARSADMFGPYAQAKDRAERRAERDKPQKRIHHASKCQRTRAIATQIATGATLSRKELRAMMYPTKYI